jgi:hypothetical protein
VLLRKIISNGYIISVSNSNIGVEITDEEYLLINEALANKPTKDGYYYKLKDISLTWEEFEIIIIPETEATEADLKAQAYDILMGVSE